MKFLLILLAFFFSLFAGAIEVDRSDIIEVDYSQLDPFIHYRHGRPTLDLKKRDAPPAQIPNQKVGVDQFVDIPILGDTTIVDRLPNDHFSDEEKLVAWNGEFDNVGIDSRALLYFGDRPKGVVKDATLKLKATTLFSILRLRVYPMHFSSANPTLNGTTWMCEHDNKVNSFDDCDVNWGGGFYADPDPEENGERIEGFHLSFQVAELLNMKGVNGFMIQWRFRGSKASFYSLESAHPPTLTVKVPKIVDNVDGFPGNAGGYSVFRNITLNGQTVRHHAYYFPGNSYAPTFRNISFVFGTGIPGNAKFQYIPLQQAEELLNYGNIIAPNLLCKGFIDPANGIYEATDCPDNMTFAYDPTPNDDEYKFFAEFIAGAQGLGLRNIQAVTWDRIDILMQILRATSPTYFAVHTYGEGWLGGFACSPERAAIPPDFINGNAHCVGEGFFTGPGSEPCLLYQPGVGCLIETPATVFLDCVARNKECSNCMTLAGVFYNDSLAADPATREACYALAGYPIAFIEAFGFGQFTATNGVATDRNLTAKEAFAVTNHWFTAPANSYLKIGDFYQPWRINKQKQLTNITHIQPVGEWERDTERAADNRELVAILKESDAPSVCLTTTDIPDFSAFTGRSVFPAIDPNYIATWKESYVFDWGNNRCHFMSVCNGDKFAAFNLFLVKTVSLPRIERSEIKNELGF